jgi:transposase
MAAGTQSISASRDGVNSGSLKTCSASGAQRVQREIDTHLYKERHLVENQIGKLKHFRRVFSRFDKLAKNYLSFIYFASTVVWLR